MLAFVTLMGSRERQYMGCCAAQQLADQRCRKFGNVRHVRRGHNVTWAEISSKSLAENTAEQSRAPRTPLATSQHPSKLGKELYSGSAGLGNMRYSGRPPCSMTQHAPLAEESK